MYLQKIILLIFLIIVTPIAIGDPTDQKDSNMNSEKVEPITLLSNHSTSATSQTITTDNNSLGNNNKEPQKSSVLSNPPIPTKQPPATWQNVPATTDTSIINNSFLCGQVYDPYEKFNRSVFTFNDTLNHTILMPLSRAYNKTVPSWGRSRVKSFFTNLQSPLTFLNNLLQGNPSAASKTFFRFLINTAFGVLGTVDFAKDFELYDEPQSFGDTFAKYGANYGAYLVLPFLGPSTVRNTAGIPFNIVVNPSNLIFTNEELIIIFLGNQFTTAAEYVDTVRSLQDTSLDYYAKVRSMYIQYITGKDPRCQQNNQIDYSIYNIDEN